MRGFHHAHELISAHSGGAEQCAIHSVVLPEGIAEWVQLMPLGTFKGRNGLGPYVVASKQAAEKVIASTLERAAGADLPVDYDHQSDFAAVPGVGGTARASGWIKELQVRDDGIYGRVEWTTAGAASLEAKEYRYISPVFAHDKKTGAVMRLLRAGLTNNPNLEMAAVAAAITTPHEDDMDFIAKLRKALGLPETTSEEAVLAHASAAQLRSSGFVALTTALAMKVDDKVEAIAAASAAITTKVKGFDDAAKAVGLKPDAAPDQLVVAINASATATIDPAKYVPAAELVSLQSQLNDLKAVVGSDKAETAINSAIESGKLAPALKPWALALHASDPAGLDAFLKTAPVVLKPGTSELAVHTAAGEDGLTADERAICSQMGVSPEDFKKNKPKLEA